MIIYHNIFTIITSQGLGVKNAEICKVCDISFGIMTPRLYLFLWRAYSVYTILYKQQNEFQNFEWLFCFMFSHSVLTLQVSLG